MKKFLPFIFFIMAFCLVVAGQVGWQTLNAGTSSQVESRYSAYEDLFLKGAFQTIDGKKIVNTKIKSPIVIYNFWASWCAPCMEEMPSLLSMKKKFKDEELQVLSFNTDETDQLINIKKVFKKFNIKDEFIAIADKNTKIADSFKFTAIPVTIIFNRGKVVQFSNGPMDFDSPELIGKLRNWANETL
jgi:thiol-disulfide isomerase/thioredoxin